MTKIELILGGPPLTTERLEAERRELQSLGMTKMPSRGRLCYFCGRDDVETVDGPAAAICLDCAENAVAALNPK